MFKALIQSLFGRGSRQGTAKLAVRRPPKKTRASVSPEPPRVARTRQSAPLPAVPSKALERQLWDQVGVEAEELKEFWSDAPATEDSTELLHLIVQAHRSLIQQPPAAARAVLNLLGRRNYGQADVTRLIEQDPALSQSLLRHSNSVFYSTKHSDPVVSIKAAVQRIGGTGVHATVMSQVVRGQLSRPGGVFDRMVSMLWEHMVAVAPIARSLARPFEVDGENAFTLGLLHDIGKLVFFSEVAALRKRKRREVRLSPHFVSAALARLHEPLGGIAALQWGLDSSSSWIIAHHHRRKLPDAPDRLSELIYVAERADIASRTGNPMNVDEVWAAGSLTVDVNRALVVLKACGALGDVEAEDPVQLQPAV